MPKRKANVNPLLAFRLQRGYTQVETAGLLGVSPISVCRWETGAHKIDVELIPKISRLTGIHPAELRPDLAKLFE
jgi:DNA-binding transcriptional regulator YdaS (Cro superfamily)